MVERGARQPRRRDQRSRADRNRSDVEELQVRVRRRRAVERRAESAFAATDTERGDEMFIAMADRSAAQILDFDGHP